MLPATAVVLLVILASRNVHGAATTGGGNGLLPFTRTLRLLRHASWQSRFNIYSRADRLPAAHDPLLGGEDTAVSSSSSSSSSSSTSSGSSSSSSSSSTRRSLVTGPTTGAPMVPCDFAIDPSAAAGDPARCRLQCDAASVGGAVPDVAVGADLHACLLAAPAGSMAGVNVVATSRVVAVSGTPPSTADWGFTLGANAVALRLRGVVNRAPLRCVRAGPGCQQHTATVLGASATSAGDDG